MDDLTNDLAKSWKHLRAIARQESFSDTGSMEKKMKSAQALTDAAERLRVLETIQKRMQTRFKKLLLYMGLNQSQVESQKVSLIPILPHICIKIHVQYIPLDSYPFLIHAARLTPIPVADVD